MTQLLNLPNYFFVFKIIFYFYLLSMFRMTLLPFQNLNQNIELQHQGCAGGVPLGTNKNFSC